MSPKITIRFAEDYRANFEFAEQIDSMICQIGDARDPRAVGRWIDVLSTFELKYEDWDRTPPLRLILYFSVRGTRPVLEGLLGPNNWFLLK